MRLEVTGALRVDRLLFRVVSQYEVFLSPLLAVILQAFVRFDGEVVVFKLHEHISLRFQNDVKDDLMQLFCLVFEHEAFEELLHVFAFQSAILAEIE